MSEFYNEVGQCFAAATELPAHARRDFIERQCHADPLLRAEVLSLLEHHESSQEFLSTPAVIEALDDQPERSSGGSSISWIPPTTATIGTYTIDQIIGEGGMGV